nr:ribonuclease H-like domain-containing protein [Tanacetum cinerariifolium]
MEHHLCHTDYPIWQVIQNGNGLVSVTTDTNGMIKVLPPKTAEEVAAKERERKARTTLLMTLPEDHLAKFYKMADAKEMWEAIKSKFKGLHKGYDRFQTLLSQLEIHGAGVSYEDANQKFLRSLPSSWSQVALIMRTKPGLDTLSFDYLYNNLRVFERDVNCTTASSSSNTQNVAFVSADNTSNTNDVSTAYSVSSPSVSKSQKEGSASYNDEVIHSFFANQSSAHQLDCNDLEQINNDDLEEMDLKWQVDMISMRIKKFYKRTGRKLAKGNQDSKRRDGGYNRNKARDNGRRPAYQDDSKALVTIDGEAIDCSGHVKEDTHNIVMMAYSSSNSEYDLENTPVNDRYAEGMHTVPPPMTGNYMPSGPDVEIDNFKFTYGPKQTSADESDSKHVEYASSDSDSRVETTTSMSAPVDNAPKIVCKPKVWTDAPIIEEYESDSDDDSVSNVQENIEKPSFAFFDSVKHVKSPRKNVKETGTHNHYTKIENFSHLIRDCDFHGKRMAKQAALTKSHKKDDLHKALKDKGIVDSRCSRHMTGNKAHLADYQNFKGGSVAFGCSNGRITGKGKIKAGRLDFEDVYYVEELKHYNLFFVSQMCDKKNKVLFTAIDCLVMSLDFKLLDENQVLLKIPRQHNMYSFNLKNIDHSGDLSCLFAKASINESNKWHRRLV